MHWRMRESRLTAVWLSKEIFARSRGCALARICSCGTSPPTALFVSNGMMTIGVLEAMEEMGLSCPADIALATFDDLPVARVFRPHLTAVVQPCYQIGYQGAGLLLQRIRGELPKTPVDIRLEPDLKIRESTKAVGAAAARPRKSGRQASKRP